MVLSESITPAAIRVAFVESIFPGTPLYNRGQTGRRRRCLLCFEFFEDFPAAECTVACRAANVCCGEYTIVHKNTIGSSVNDSRRRIMRTDGITDRRNGYCALSAR